MRLWGKFHTFPFEGMGGRVRILVATGLGMLPGLLFPVVVAARYPRHESDLFLLAMSVGTTVVGIFSTALEMHVVGDLGKIHLSTLRSEYLVKMRRYVLIRLAPISFGISAVVGALYYARGSGDLRFLMLAGVFGLMPCLASLGSLYSASLISEGRVAEAVGAQGLRQVVALFAVVTFGPPIFAVCLLVLGGEMLRIAYLTRRAAGLILPGRIRSLSRLQVSGLYWQASSVAVSQSGPITDRAVLATAPGAVTAYELADKLYYAAQQFVQYGVLTSEVSRWAKLDLRKGNDWNRFTSSRLKLLVLATCLAVLGAATLYTLGLSVVPRSLSQGFIWGAIVTTSMPAVVSNTICSRALILLKREPLLIRISVGTVSLNAIADVVLFVVLGPLGVIVSTVVVRYVIAVAYFVVLERARVGVEVPLL